jgi:hypothetical protein
MPKLIVVPKLDRSEAFFPRSTTLAEDRSPVSSTPGLSNGSDNKHRSSVVARTRSFCLWEQRANHLTRRWLRRRTSFRREGHPASAGCLQVHPPTQRESGLPAASAPRQVGHQQRPCTYALPNQRSLPSRHFGLDPLPEGACPEARIGLCQPAVLRSTAGIPVRRVGRQAGVGRRPSRPADPATADLGRVDGHPGT